MLIYLALIIAVLLGFVVTWAWLTVGYARFRRGKRQLQWSDKDWPEGLMPKQPPKGTPREQRKEKLRRMRRIRDLNRWYAERERDGYR